MFKIHETIVMPSVVNTGATVKITVAIRENTWKNIRDNFSSWKAVRDYFKSWLEVRDYM